MRAFRRTTEQKLADQQWVRRKTAVSRLLKMERFSERELDWSDLGLKTLPPNPLPSSLDDLFPDGFPSIERCFSSHLSELRLSGNQLTELPPEIGNLIHLSQLDLSDNQLAELPPEMRNLGHLSELDLSGNLLTELPPWIGNLRHLSKLNLSGNQLTELPPGIANLRHLSKLDLSGNLLTELPPWIGNLIHLSEFNLSGNLLTELPEEILDLKILSSLDFSKNNCCCPPGAHVVLPRVDQSYYVAHRITSLKWIIGTCPLQSS